ncbi:MAG: transcription-repair coupling factor [Proteobacteria bacterium]|nr:transcription-repair coupling factor [Pseudomonadota bacterium]
MNQNQTCSVLEPPGLRSHDQRIHWGNLNGSSLSLAVSCLTRQNQALILLIAPDIQTARRLETEVRFFTDGLVPCYYFPDWETLPYDHFSPHPDLVSERLFLLNRLLSLQQGVIISALPTLMQKVLPKQYLLSFTLSLSVDEILDLHRFRDRLNQAGYHSVNQVFEHGEYAIRGAIFDIFPMGSSSPYRIELFDDKIESIRSFDPETQCSVEKIAKLNLFPAREYPLTETSIQFFRQHWRAKFPGNPKESSLYENISEGMPAAGAEYYLPLFFEELNTFFDYLPEQTQIVCSHQLSEAAEKFWQEANNRYQQLRHDRQRPLCEPESLFLAPNEVFAKMKMLPQIQCHLEPLTPKTGHFNFDTQKPPLLPVDHKAKNPLNLLQNFLIPISEKPQISVLFCAETTGRREILMELLSEIKLKPDTFHSWQQFLSAKSPTIGICVAPMDLGLWLKNPELILICESQLFGEQVQQRRLRKSARQDPATIIKNLTELQIGAPVVHSEHGVGRYLGLEQMSAGGQQGEYLKLEYSAGDKIYVPVTSLHLISRYTGADSDHAPLQKLGTKQWQNIKRKTAEQVRDVAAELLNIYSQRMAAPGHAFKKPDHAFLQFRRAFPFEETPDQTKAIDAVIEDMTATRCMDRLVCGDVGFGKTEVAMQAAFLAVQDGKQVAVLVPTTLLAEQHLHTFRDRFADSPVQIAAFSRMQTPKDLKAAIQKLAEGKIDIAIGTHKLLSEEIHFKDLGLLIIDEEHRFGVRQKERIKALRAHVDILTLTATPIPRTLNMALAGTRDLSIIATPPAKRLSIKTFVYEYEAGIIREAVLREAMRGGQLYFLHNEVETIAAMVQKLQSIVPEARIGMAHGQMHERELEKIMADFYHQRFNLLVCTTIIESGIDIPTANTIIINRANRFGLAQLHQLRGRVGRSHHQAYAYLLVPADQKLNPDAEKRLTAISQLENLGAGFQLATHDLEIRGAGELLGEEQSGHIHAVGFSLYMELLEAAVSALKAGKDPSLELPESINIEVNLHIAALIPESYLPDVALRLSLYKRLADCEHKQEIDELKAEMIDRFGPFSDATQQLFAITQLKLQLKPLGIIKVDVGDQFGYFHFTEKPNINLQKLILLIQKYPKLYQFQGGVTLRFKVTHADPKQKIEAVEHMIKMLKE